MKQQITAINKFEDTGAALEADVAALLARRKATFGAASWLFYDEPLLPVRAEGVWVFDAAGKRYLDMYNNVPSVGHCHPRVVAAIARQAAVLNIHTRYLYDIIHDYAERLLATYPAELSNIVFTCTGSESNDLALRLAKAFTGGAGFVVTETAYHGNTAAATEVSPSSFKTGQVPAHVRAVPAPDAHAQGVADPGPAFANAVQAAIDDLAAHGVKFAGLLVDTIFSSDGVHAEPAGFLAAAVAVARRAGGLFIADEVQPGFGRTGTMWGFARHGVTPDIATMGKPMGNGYPLGGVVTRPEILTAFCEETGYFNTFGGSPVAAAAGLAVLEVIAEEGLLGNAAATGAYLRGLLRDVAARHPGIGDVRGAGLFTGVAFSRPDGTADGAAATHVVNALRRRGVLVSAAGAQGDTLKVRPPLCFSRDNADYFIEALDRVLTGMPAPQG